MSRDIDGANDVNALARALGIAGFSDEAPGEAKKPVEDPMAALGRAVGLKTGRSLMPEGAPANDNRHAPPKPAAVVAPAAPPRINLTTASAPKVQAAASQPSGSYFWISGCDTTVRRVQETLGLPADCYRASGPNGLCMQAWRLPSDQPPRALARQIMGAGASGFGTERKLDRRFKAFGSRAGEVLPGAVIARLQGA